MPCGIYDLKALKVNCVFKSGDLDLGYLRDNKLYDSPVWRRKKKKKKSVFHFNSLISFVSRGKNILVILYSQYPIN